MRLHPDARRHFLLTLICVALAMGWRLLATDAECADRLTWVQSLLDEGQVPVALGELQQMDQQLGARSDIVHLAGFATAADEAFRMIRSRQTEAVLAYLTGLQEAHGDQALLHLLLGRAFRSRGQLKESRQAIQRGRELAPQSQLLQQERL